MKQCSKCKQLLEFSFFYKKQTAYSSQCKTCLSLANQHRYMYKQDSIKKQASEYYKTNQTQILNREANKRATASPERKEKLAEYHRKYRELNKEQIKEVRKQWYSNTLEDRQNYSRKYIKEWNQKNKHIVLWCTLLTTCFNRLKTKKTDNTQKQLGYAHKELKERMESYFTTDMTWENHGSFWNAHHNIPVTWFNPEAPASIVSHLKNLYPLDKKTNFSIGNRKVLYPVDEEYKKQAQQWLLPNFLHILNNNEHIYNQ